MEVTKFVKLSSIFNRKNLEHIKLSGGTCYEDVQHLKYAKIVKDVLLTFEEDLDQMKHKVFFTHSYFSTSKSKSKYQKNN